MIRTPVFQLAKRFLFSSASDGFLSFIAWVSVGGITLGVLALTVVTSVINGFEGELSRVITSVNGEVLLYSRGEPIRDAAEIEQEIVKVAPDVKALCASFVSEVMASGPTGVSGAVLQGIEPERIGAVTEIPKKIIEGHFILSDSQEGVEFVVGSALAEKLGVQIDSEMRILTPWMEADGSGSLSGVLIGKVVGILHLGMYDYDSKFIYASLGAVQRFFQRPGQITTLNMKLKTPALSRSVADQLSVFFDYPFRVKDWSQLNKNLFYAIELEKAVIAIILTVIVLVAAFNVVSTLMMMIHDKSKEIAILKAMGFRPIQSFQLFCMIGLGLGIAGALSGVLSGLILVVVMDQTQWIRLPEDIYYIGFLPAVVHWKEIVGIAGMTVLISFLATLYPAWSVSKRSPLEGLRYE